MARRIELRSLQDRVRALRARAGRLLESVEGWSPNFQSHPSLNKRQRRDLAQLIAAAQHLAMVVRTLNPIDYAWRFYDKDIADLEERLDRRTDANPFGQERVTTSAIYALRKALEMIEAAASRITNPRLTETQAFAGSMMYGTSEAVRSGARTVLADMLEELGFHGEANAIRAGLWSRDRAVLPRLGVRLSRMRPTTGYDAEGRAK